MELLVAGGLAAVLFLLLTSLLIRVSGVVQRVLTLNELQQTAEVLAGRIGSLTQRCDVGGVGFYQDAGLTALSLHPVEDVTPTAHKLYAETVTLLAWRPDNQTLSEIHSRPYPMKDRWQPIKLGPDAIQLLAQEPPRRILARTVLKMELTSPTGINPLLMKLVLQKNAPGGGPQSVVLERHLTLRNVF